MDFEREQQAMTIEMKGTTMTRRVSAHRAPMERRFLGAVGALFLIPALWGCGGGAQAGAAEEGAFTRLINVEVHEVRPSSFSEIIRLTGTVQANRDVVVSAEESGVVREILAEKGNRVRVGEPLFRLDSELLEAQVAQARAQSSMAQETWERRRRLFEEDQVGSELVYLEARYTAEQAAANFRQPRRGG